MCKMMACSIGEGTHFPTTVFDCAKRDLALALIAQRPGIPGRVHLWAMLLATQPGQMRRYLSKTSLARYNRRIPARRSFIMPSGQPLGWSELETNLIVLEAVTIRDPVGKRRLYPGRTFHQTTRTHPETAMELAQLALEAVEVFCESLRNLSGR